MTILSSSQIIRISRGSLAASLRPSFIRQYPMMARDNSISNPRCTQTWSFKIRISPSRWGLWLRWLSRRRSRLRTKQDLDHLNSGDPHPKKAAVSKNLTPSCTTVFRTSRWAKARNRKKKKSNRPYLLLLENLTLSMEHYQHQSVDLLNNLVNNQQLENQDNLKSQNK